jgi:uncharacterized protein
MKITRGINIEEKLKILEEMAKSELKNADPANDFFHTEIAIKVAKYLCKQEGAEFSIVKAALLLHHISPRRFKDKSISPYREESLQKGKKILDDLGFPKELASEILRCVEATYFGNEEKATTIEAKVAHDANKLVTIGALGIARTFTFGGYFKRAIYNPSKSLIRGRDEIEKEVPVQYDPSSLEPDTVSHFKTKLLRIKDKMLTATGRKLAEKRHKFMIEFLNNFFDEIEIS